MKTNDFRDEWKGWIDLPQHKEGNTGKYIKYQTFLFDLISKEKPNSILEVGFNAGHSACCFLNASSESKMVTFDICRHGTESPAFDVLKNYFDLELIEGDSTLTVPEYFKNNPNSSFDFIFIDGGHSDDVPYKDITNTLPYLNKNGIIIIDDARGIPVAEAIKKVNWSNFDEIIPPSIEKRIKAFRRIK